MGAGAGWVAGAEPGWVAGAEPGWVPAAEPFACGKPFVCGEAGGVSGVSARTLRPFT